MIWYKNEIKIKLEENIFDQEFNEEEYSVDSKQHLPAWMPENPSRNR